MKLKNNLSSINMTNIEWLKESGQLIDNTAYEAYRKKIRLSLSLSLPILFTSLILVVVAREIQKTVLFFTASTFMVLSLVALVITYLYIIKNKKRISLYRLYTKNPKDFEELG